MILHDSTVTHYMSNGRDLYWNHVVDPQADLLVIIASGRQCQVEGGFTAAFDGVSMGAIAASNGGWYGEKLYMFAQKNPPTGSNQCHTWIGNGCDYQVCSLSFINTDRVGSAWANGGGTRSWGGNPSRVLSVDGYSSLRLGAVTSDTGTVQTFTPLAPIGFTTLVNNYKQINNTLHVTMLDDTLDPDDSTFTWSGNQGSLWWSVVTAELLHGVSAPAKMIYRI